MINEKLLKQKLHKKSILENKLLKAIKSNRLDDVYILNEKILILHLEIKEIQNS